jgi:quinol monooxygenase YgiN
LLGSFFLGMADGVGDRGSLDATSLATAFEAGGARVQKQTKAQLGDKTMLDSLLPALGALRASADAGDDAARALHNAADAAAHGADLTRNWLPKFGKARFSGERSRGHPDPGATSLAMIFAGLSAGIQALGAKAEANTTESPMLKKAEKEIVCVAQFIAKEGKEEELLQSLHSLIAPTHQEPGYIRYELNQAIENPRAITFIEKFRSQEDFDFHCNTPYIKGFFDQVAPPLMEGVTVTLYKEILP